MNLNREAENISLLLVNFLLYQTSIEIYQLGTVSLNGLDVSLQSYTNID